VFVRLERFEEAEAHLLAAFDAAEGNPALRTCTNPLLVRLYEKRGEGRRWRTSTGQVPDFADALRSAR
jgi:hypothetical protein